MQERKTPESNPTNSDATNKETLEDLEESEQVSDSKRPASDQALSPDGPLVESDEIKDAGPI